MLAGSALAALCAHVSIPLYFTPVPLTLAPFAVLLPRALCFRPASPRPLSALISLEGALGLPVFAPSPIPIGGLAHLLGPTGGYLLCYPLGRRPHLLPLAPHRAAALPPPSSAPPPATSPFSLCGALWLAVLTHAPARLRILTLAVIPFLPGDALKIVAAAALVTGFQRLRRRNPQPHLSDANS